MNTFESGNKIAEEGKQQEDANKNHGKYIKKFAAPLAAGAMMLADAGQALANNKNEINVNLKAPIGTIERQDRDMKEKIKNTLREKSQEMNDKNKNENKNQEIAKRMQELNGYAKRLGVDGLELGKAKKNIAGYVEQWGVYIKGQYIGDIRSSVPFNSGFLLGAISQLEQVKNEIKGKREKFQKQELNKINKQIDPEAFDILTSWGGRIEEKNRLIYVSPSEKALSYDENTETIRLKKMTNKGVDGLAIVCVNKDGKVSTAYAEGGVIKINSFESK